MTLAIVIFIASCSNSQNENSEIKVQETESSEVAKVYIKDKGPFRTDYTYNIALARKKISAQSFIIIGDTAIIVRAKKDTWKYKILEVQESNEDIYKVLVNGGHIFIGSDEDYTITISKGIILTERMSNDASWFDVSESARLSLENLLDKQGLVFHR